MIRTLIITLFAVLLLIEVYGIVIRNDAATDARVAAEQNGRDSLSVDRGSREPRTTNHQPRSQK